MSTREYVRMLAWRGDQLALVQEQGPEDPFPSWGVPGGRVEAGETARAAALRELREETGLTRAHRVRLVYTAHLTFAHTNKQAVAYGYECQLPADAVLQPADPDGLVLAAAFVTRDTAIERITQCPFAVVTAPVMAYLRGRARGGAVWRILAEQLTAIGRPRPKLPLNALPRRSQAASTKRVERSACA